MNLYFSQNSSLFLRLLLDRFMQTLVFGCFHYEITTVCPKNVWQFGITLHNNGSSVSLFTMAVHDQYIDSVWLPTMAV